MQPHRLDELVPLLDSTAPPRVVSRADLIARGYSRRAIDHRVAVGRWRRILPRTYLTSDTLTWPDRLTAAVTFAGEGAILTAAAALADTGLRCVDRPQTISVLVPQTTRVLSRDWVHVSRTARMPQQALFPGPPRAVASRAVGDLARRLRRLDDVRALVAESVRRRHCTVSELVSELAAGPRRGSANFSTAIEEVRRGAWSAPEARAARILTRSTVPPFEQNARIDIQGGRFVVVDFLWRELWAVLEIDSLEHHFAPADLDATMSRHLLLETLGYSVVHRSPAAIAKDPSTFVRGISAWLASRSRA